MASTTIDILFYPGRYYSKTILEQITTQLRSVASTCFDEVPNYQVLTGDRKEMSRAIIAVAKDKQGQIKAFCSALILDVDGIGEIFHTGLTCVDPSVRGQGLTHKLTSKLLTSYIFKESLFKKTWITNCACVLSSIGNVALHFDNVFPSPFGQKEPSKEHLMIAQAIDKYYREPIAINESANFNQETFVFEGSVKDSSFEKDENDSRYFHRDVVVNNFYKNYLNFENGDEVLQIGQVSILSFIKYGLKGLGKRLPLKPRRQTSYAN